MTAPGAALTATRDELHERVLAFVRRRVPNADDAEDIAQEVMLRIHRHSADLEHAERMTAWVYRIAANAITDHFRRPARREVPSGDAVDVAEGESETPSWAETPPEELRRELATCLAPLIERLPSIYREALVIVEFEGLSQPEAAARLGISVSGMKARVQRARRQLGQELLACCAVDLDRRRSVTAIHSRGEPCERCGTR